MDDDETIYVRLTDEAVMVWRPVPARRLADRVYTLVGDGPDPEIETWEFGPGDRVRVEPRDLSGGSFLVAVAKAPDNPPSRNMTKASFDGRPPPLLSLGPWL